MLDERAVFLNPFMRCTCSRLHTREFIGPLTECACGVRLFTLAWAVPAPRSGCGCRMVTLE